MLRIRYKNLGISEDESRSFSHECKVFDCLHSWVWGYSSSQFNIDGSRYAFSRHFCDPKYLDNMCFKSYVFPSEDNFVSYAIYQMNESHQYYLASLEAEKKAKEDREAEKYWFNNKNEYFDG